MLDKGLKKNMKKKKREKLENINYNEVGALNMKYKKRKKTR